MSAHTFKLFSAQLQLDAATNWKIINVGTETGMGTETGKHGNMGTEMESNLLKLIYWKTWKHRNGNRVKLIY